MILCWIPLSAARLHTDIQGCRFADSEQAGRSLLFYKEHRARGMVLGVFMWEIKEFACWPKAHVHLLMKPVHINRGTN